MSFAEVLEIRPESALRALGERACLADVDAAIAREERSLRDLAVLLSPAARPRLEAMAREAHRLTRHHFGRTISLYAPMYISNLCAADCVYCCFSVRNVTTDRRTTLRPREIRQECEALAAHGFDNVLLLTGEAPKRVTVARIAEAVAIAREYFTSVSVEVYAMEQEGYAELVDAGLEGVTLYMETYDRATYAQVHLEGEKSNYDFRLDAIERAGRAGARKLSIGALLGLHDWRVEVLRLALHAKHVQKVCWQSALSLSLPRLLHTPERFQVLQPVPDAEFVQILLALRLFLPDVGFNLSTRERPALRDKLIPLGVTAMSAGSSTRPGGYASRGDDVLEQFEIEDFRPVDEVVASIRRAGYDPVWKDFDHAFVG